MFLDSHLRVWCLTQRKWRLEGPSDEERVLATWIHPVNVTVNDDVLVRMHLILDVSGPDCTTIPMNLSL